MAESKVNIGSKYDDDNRIGTEIQIDFNEIYSKCDVIVNEYNPHISYSNIDTDGILYGDTKPLDYICLILNSFVIGLTTNLVVSPNDIIENLNNLYLMVGGELKEENDIVHKGFSFLVNSDGKTINKLKAFFNDTNINQLFEKLINNITVLKVVSYDTSNLNEYKATKFENQADVNDASSLIVYYDSISDNGFIIIEWGKATNLFNLA